MRFRPERAGRGENAWPVPAVANLLLLLMLGVCAARAGSPLPSEIPVTLPEAAGEPAGRMLRALVLDVRADGLAVLAGQTLEGEKLAAVLARAASCGIEELQIRADAAVPHRRVVEILAVCRAAGIRRANFQTVMPAGPGD